jgi:predicted GNAT family N-acyltransferase
MSFGCIRFKIDDPAMDAARHIREVVFCVEQGVTAAEEWDDKDEICDHFLLSDGKTPVGTARTRTYAPGIAKVERVAVLKDYRRLGAGRAMMEAVLDHLRAAGFKTAVLNAQVAVEDFYKDLGFVSEGDHFDEAGIEHVRMTRAL